MKQCSQGNYPCGQILMKISPSFLIPSNPMQGSRMGVCSVLFLEGLDVCRREVGWKVSMGSHSWLLHWHTTSFVGITIIHIFVMGSFLALVTWGWALVSVETQAQIGFSAVDAETIFPQVLVASEVKGYGKVSGPHKQDFLWGYEERMETHVVLGRKNKSKPWSQRE